MVCASQLSRGKGQDTLHDGSATSTPMEMSATMSENVSQVLQKVKQNILPHGWTLSLDEKPRPKGKGSVIVDKYWSDDKGNRYRSFVEVKRSTLSAEFIDQQPEVLASDAGSVEVEQPAAALTKSPNQADTVIAYEAIYSFIALIIPHWLNYTHWMGKLTEFKKKTKKEPMMMRSVNRQWRVSLNATQYNKRGLPPDTHSLPFILHAVGPVNLLNLRLASHPTHNLVDRVTCCWLLLQPSSCSALAPAPTPLIGGVQDFDTMMLIIKTWRCWQRCNARSIAMGRGPIVTPAGSLYATFLGVLNFFPSIKASHVLRYGLLGEKGGALRQLCWRFLFAQARVLVAEGTNSCMIRIDPL